METSFRGNDFETIKNVWSPKIAHLGHPKVAVQSSPPMARQSIPHKPPEEALMDQPSWPTWARRNVLLGSPLVAHQRPHTGPPISHNAASHLPNLALPGNPKWSSLSTQCGPLRHPTLAKQRGPPRPPSVPSRATQIGPSGPLEVSLPGQSKRPT